MEVSFEIEDVTGKELDDVADAVLVYITQELGYTVSEYWVSVD